MHLVFNLIGKGTKAPMSPIQRLAVWIEDYWAQLFSVLGSLFLAIAGILASVQNYKNWSWLIHTVYGNFLIFGVIFSIIGGLSITFLSRGNKSLKNEVYRLKGELDLRKKRYAELINGELLILSQILNFENNERISLYKHEGKAFVMLGRYSLNPEHRKKGRGIYPDTQGCIANAWRQGKVFVDNLPDVEEKYCQVVQRDWNMPPDVTRGLTMRSRTIAAFSISDFQNDRIAVIIFESVRDKAFREHKLQEIMSNGEEKRIALLLEKTASVEPASQYALEEGY